MIGGWADSTGASERQRHSAMKTAVDVTAVSMGGCDG